MQEALKADYLSHWLNKFGLCKLEEGVELNDNGILFHAFAIWLFSHINLVDNEDLRRDFATIKGLESGIPGLFIRYPGDFRREAHDNYVGICALSLLHGFSFSRDIVEYGNLNGFVYNNESPPTWALWAQRQGGDIAFYKICGGYIPPIWEWLWLLLGILSAAFIGDPSPVNLTWLRIQCIDFAIEKKLPIYRIGWMAASFYFTKMVFDLTIRTRFGGIQGSLARYFRPDHPINILARSIFK